MSCFLCGCLLFVNNNGADSGNGKCDKFSFFPQISETPEQSFTSLNKLFNAPFSHFMWISLVLSTGYPVPKVKSQIKCCRLTLSHYTKMCLYHILTKVNQPASDAVSFEDEGYCRT